jgi:beta-glucanase (GH16 family)
MINFCNYTWITKERWGEVHPDKPYVWYDSDSVVQNSSTEISLISKYKPKYFEHIGRTAQMAVGLLSSTEKFGYGRFDLEAKLPNLPYSWPAFWMWSWSDWPPEIDVFEGYSDKKGRYDLSLWSKIFNNIFYKVESNIHIKDRDTKWDIGGRPHFFGHRDPRYNFNKYSVIWTPRLISFYYNDTLVRKVEDGRVLQLVNGHKMNVIINTSCYRYHKDHLKNVGEMKIKNFKYTSL